MATLAELAGTVESIRGEMARRIDGLQAEGSMSSGAAASMDGILEWLASLEDAVRNCDGRPSPKGGEEAAARAAEDAERAMAAGLADARAASMGGPLLYRLSAAGATHVRAHLPAGHPETAAVLSALESGGVGTFFCEGDIAHLPDEMACEFLGQHARHIEDALAERGNEVIEQLLLAEGIGPEDEDDADEGD